MKSAKNRVKIHTPYIICNDMMYNTWEEIAENVPNFSIMTNSVANNGNPFGSADYAKNRNKILNTGIDIWEYYRLAVGVLRFSDKMDDCILSLIDCKALSMCSLRLKILMLKLKKN